MYFQKSIVKGKIALVTGAGKGIGKASAIALAEAGADLIILSRTKSDLEKVKKQIVKLKRKCAIYECDVANLVDLNIKAAFHVAQMGAKVMLKSKNRKSIGGSIINISSQLGKVGAPKRSIYNMTKFGIEGLTRGMALDLAKDNIRVNTVCPTFVETPMVKKFFKDKKFKTQMINNIPLGRLATESDIATAVVYLASNASSMITGSSLMIDGGWTAK